MTGFASSLCHTCSFVRTVQGRRDQTYLLCRNETVAAKYPPQPVVACPGYIPGSPGEASSSAAS
jgi:hypothetical protein